MLYNTKDYYLYCPVNKIYFLFFSNNMSVDSVTELFCLLKTKKLNGGQFLRLWGTWEAEITITAEALAHNAEGQRSGRPAVSRHSTCLRAGMAVVSSYLLQRAEDKASPPSDRKIEVERHLPSLPLSPLLLVLCGNICFLRCTFPSCSGRVLCAAPLALLF